METPPTPPKNLDTNGTPFSDALTNEGPSLAELSFENPILAIFLRHSGCTFCREALSDISHHRKSIEATGVKIALIHMSSPSSFSIFARGYNLDDVLAVSDPDRRHYRALGLRRGNLAQLCGWNVWLRSAQSLFGHGLGRIEGDGKQMPGVFLLFKGEIINRYIHTTAGDRPDYIAICKTTL